MTVQQLAHKLQTMPDQEAIVYIGVTHQWAKDEIEGEILPFDQNDIADCLGYVTITVMSKVTKDTR